MNKLGQWCKYFFLMLGVSLPAFAHAGYTRYEETHAAVIYEGSWRSVSGSAVSGGSVMASDATGASATFTFRGTGVKYIGYRCTCTNGIARVYIDGVQRGSFNTWAQTPEAQRELFALSGLANQRHTLRIEVTGERRSNGDNAYIAVDAFDVENGTAIATYEDNSPQVTYVGNWTEFHDPSVSGGTVRASRDPGAKATFRFNGIGFTWIGYVSPVAAGMAYMTIDGQTNGTTVAHGGYNVTTTQPQFQMYDNQQGYAQGPHEMLIEVSGASTRGTPETAWVVIDAFKVYGGSGNGDTIAPTITMTSPTGNADVSGVATLTASASDNTGVTKVQFLRGDIVLGEDTTAPYSMTRDMSGVMIDNTYSIKARAWDAAGNYNDTPVYQITVRHLFERNPPLVNIVRPADGSSVSGTVAIEVEANDDSGIAAVFGELDAPGTRASAAIYVRSMPATLNTLLLTDGRHELYAMAKDIHDAYSTIDAVSFTVDNSVQPGMTRIDSDSADILYTGTWTTYGGQNSDGWEMFHWNDAQGTATIGATATLTFEGTGVRWIGARCIVCGDALVSIDGGAAQPVGTRSGTDLTEPGNRASVLYTSPMLAFGTHTLKITVVEEFPPSSNLVLVDAFEVLR